MVPDRLLPDLLAAERALGRLDQALSDPARRHRHRFDAARRTAAAMLRLDGERLDPHDFQVALAAADQASGAPARAALLSGLITQLQAGLTRHDPPLSPRPAAVPSLDPRLSPDRRTRMEAAIQADVVAAARASIADLNRFDVSGGGELDGAGTSGAAAPLPDPPLSLWTLAWLEELHRRWTMTQGGREAGLTDPQRSSARAVLTGVDEVLSATPGLLAAAAAFRRLSQSPDVSAPDRSAYGGNEDLAAALMQCPRASWWSVVAWLAAPSLIQAACRLHFAWPALTPALARDTTGYRLALSDTDTAWTTWFLGTIQDLVGSELERLRFLDVLQDRWEERLASQVRRSTSRLPDLLPWLFEHPAFTVSRVAADLKARFGLSMRGAHLLTAQLAAVGIVREVPGRGGERVWVTDLSFLPPGR